MPISKYHTCSNSNYCGSNMHPALTHIVLVIQFHKHRPVVKRGKIYPPRKVQRMHFTKKKPCAAENYGELNSFGLYWIHIRHVIDAYKTAFPPSLPQVTEPHLCDQHFSLSTLSCLAMRTISHCRTQNHFLYYKVGTFPDAKPLELVGCYSPLVKESFVRQVGAKENFHL